MGAIYAVLPAGCISPRVQSGTYYLCGNTWFQPSYGANGVYYRVVPAPTEDAQRDSLHSRGTTSQTIAVNQLVVALFVFGCTLVSALLGGR